MSRSMKALVYEGPRKLALQQVPVPEPGPGQVLLRTKAVGICGSDVHGYLGLTGRRIPPMVMGHEVAAEIVAVGPEVRWGSEEGGLAPGRRYAVNPLITCGECQFCRCGHDNLCVHRIGLGMMSTAGAMSEYFVAPAANLVPLPDDVDPVVGALAEPMAVGSHAVALMDRYLHGGVRAGETIAVIGAGVIGLSVVAALAARGLRSVVVCDVRSDRLARLRALAPWVTTVDTSGESWESVRARHAPEGFAGVFEAVGRPATAQGSVELTRPLGVVVWIGNSEPIVSVPMQQVVTQEIRIIGSYGFTAQEFRESVGRLRELAWLEGVVDKRVPLEAAAAAFEELAVGQTDALKIAICLD